MKERTEGQGSNQIPLIDSAQAQLEEGGSKRNGPKPRRQHRKDEKQNLKDSEQEEQLKFTRCFISTLERKVIELENSNKILRMGSLSRSLDSWCNISKVEKR